MKKVKVKFEKLDKETRNPIGQIVKEFDNISKAHAWIADTYEKSDKGLLDYKLGSGSTDY
jgi:hypothetical protein